MQDKKRTAWVALWEPIQENEISFPDLGRYFVTDLGLILYFPSVRVPQSALFEFTAFLNTFCSSP